MKFCTYNINYSRRAIGEYEKYNFNNRKQHIYQFLAMLNADVLHIQEIHNDYSAR